VVHGTRVHGRSEGPSGRAVIILVVRAALCALRGIHVFWFALCARQVPFEGGHLSLAVLQASPLSPSCFMPTARLLGVSCPPLRRGASTWPLACSDCWPFWQECRCEHQHDQVHVSI
jgi:hypothetical protein